MEILNKLVSERAMLLYIFVGMVGFFAYGDVTGLEISDPLVWLFGLLTREFLVTASKVIKRDVEDTPVVIQQLPTKPQVDFKESLARLAK